MSFRSARGACYSATGNVTGRPGTKRDVRTASVIPLLFLAAACGTAEPGPARWQDSMQRWYANTSVRPPEPPRAQWERVDEDLLLKRIGFADLVVVGTAREVTLFTMLGAPKRVAFAFTPREVLYGSLADLIDEQGDLLLPLSPNDLDFQLALRVLDHIAGSRYLMLLKRQPLAKGPPTLHWSLYKPDRRLLVEIRAMFDWLKKKKRD